MDHDYHMTIPTIDIIHIENPTEMTTSFFCQTCYINYDRCKLRHVRKRHSYNGQFEIYSEMLEYCFSIEIGDIKNAENSENDWFICIPCISKLRGVMEFRVQIERAQENIKQTYNDTKVLISEINDELPIIYDDLTSCDWLINDDQPKTPPENDVTENMKTSSVITSTSITLTPQAKPKKKKKKKKPKKCSDRGYFPYVLEKDQLQCKECHETFDTNKSLRVHMPVHFPNYTCEVCGRNFANRDQVGMHCRNKHPSNTESAERHPCPTCGLTFKTNQIMRVHIKRVHLKISIHKCLYCEERFLHYQQRQKHMIMDHGKTNEATKYKCKYCEKRFSTNSARYYHMYTHGIEKKNECETCGKTFCKPYQLRLHQRVHTGIKIFTCDLCPKSYGKRCTLNIHMKSVHPVSVECNENGK